MDTRDFDRWARLIAASCSRRRTFQVLGAGGLAFGLGRRARFDALAAELGCCKCSGTLRCELDVATYGECKTICGPTKQAIFAPNYTCTRGNSLSSVCKPKRKSTGATLLAGTPGVYDLAFVDTLAAAAIPGLAPVTNEVIFTAPAAIAAGFVRENAAAVLFEEGVQVYHSLWRNADETLGVFSHVSQHLTAEGAARWYEYALPQIGPADAETFDFELSGTDAGVLIRFAFLSQTVPGETITRVMGMTLTGEFVNWFGLDGHNTVPDPDQARVFAQAVVDALIERPEQTASLAPYVALLPGAMACLPDFPATAAKRAGAPAGFQDRAAECEAPAGNIRYPVWDGAYVPRFDATDGVIALNQRFIAGADRMLEQTYMVGNQIRTITITNWWHPDVVADDGRLFFARLAELDAARGAIRQELDMPHAGASGRWFCSAFAFNAGEQGIYGVDAVAFAPPYSLSLGVLQPGAPVADPATWVAAEVPVIIDELWPVIAATQLEMGLDAWHDQLHETADQPLAAYGSALTALLPADEADAVGSGTRRRDFGAIAAALARSIPLTDFTFDGHSGTVYFTADAAVEVPLLPGVDFATQEEVVREFFSDQGLLQLRFDRFVNEDQTERIDLVQLQCPDRACAEATREYLAAEMGGLASGFDPSELSDPDRDGSGLTWQMEGEDTEDTGDTEDTFYLLIDDNEIVTTVIRSTTRTSSSDADEAEDWPREVFENLTEWYDEDDWAAEVSDAAEELTRWLPALDAQTQSYLQYYYGSVDGEQIPRFGDDPDPIAAENPWVRNALYGGYGLDSELGKIDVSFGVRSFSDDSEATGYLEQVPSQLPDLRLEINWLTGQPLSDLDEFPHVVHGGTWQADEGDFRIGVNIAIQDGPIIFDVSAFAPYTGDEAAFPDLDVFADPAFSSLSQGAVELILAAYDQAAKGVPNGYLPDPLAMPASWQSPIARGGGEEAPRQYDPVAWVGNVALALSEYETTPLAFVFEPQHEAAIAAFYGAAPPAGWQGLLRTALFAPDPTAINGQGFNQALYLKAHWFDTDTSAREWYLTGKPLLEASGNGRYVEQTGEADFGSQRGVWGSTFPTADNPNVIIQRGIAWFQQGQVVAEVTLDAHCAAAQPAGALCTDGTVPYLVEDLGPLLADTLTAAETDRVVTDALPVLAGTPFVQVDVAQWLDQTIRRFGQSAEELERREAFNFGAEGRLSSQYTGPDAGGNPVAVFGNSWITESFAATQDLLAELFRDVEENDRRIGAERTVIPGFALSGQGWSVTANAFVFTQPDGTKLGGAEVQVARESVVHTAAVVTPRPPETTAQDVRADVEQRIAAAAQNPEGTRDAELAVLFTAVSAELGTDPRDVLDVVASSASSAEYEPDDDDDEGDPGVTSVEPPELEVDTSSEYGQPSGESVLGILTEVSVFS